MTIERQPVRYAVIALIVVACAMRFVGLEMAPPGFFFDEAMGAAHSVCYAQTGRDVFGHIGLFSHVDFNNTQSAPFLMGGALWTKVFGIGVAGFRSFVAFVGVVAVLGVYRLVRVVSADAEMAVWATLFAACLPWAFLFSRISWDAPLGVALLVWALALVYTPNNKYWPLAGAAVLAFASYTYVPMRAQAALMLVLLPRIAVREKAKLIGVFAVLNLPLLAYSMDPAFTARMKMLALTSNDPLNPYRDSNVIGLTRAFVENFAAHFSPRFLLLSGDANVRHSIQTFGMLDAVTFTGSLVALAFLVRMIVRRAVVETREATVLTLALLGVVSAVTPAALTWSAIPHGVRALGAWPFFAVLAAHGWTRVFVHVPRFRFVVAGASAVLFGLYLRSWYIDYPVLARSWFDVEQVRQIRETRTFPDRYGPVTRAYYRMTVLGERCEDVRKG
ncbi:MAG TPA: hypothetical protein VM076_02015 [Gemmatimonadaceae bacterium]|nr:hypothetical protein [Gemmatimonadaceae bacterium]